MTDKATPETPRADAEKCPWCGKFDHEDGGCQPPDDVPAAPATTGVPPRAEKEAEIEARLAQTRDPREAMTLLQSLVASAREACNENVEHYRLAFDRVQALEAEVEALRRERDEARDRCILLALERDQAPGEAFGAIRDLEAALKIAGENNDQLEDRAATAESRLAEVTRERDEARLGALSMQRNWEQACESQRMTAEQRNAAETRCRALEADREALAEALRGTEKLLNEVYEAVDWNHLHWNADDPACPATHDGGTCTCGATELFHRVLDALWPDRPGHEQCQRPRRALASHGAQEVKP